MANQKTPPERVLITNHFINKHGKSNVCTHMYISIQTGYILKAEVRGRNKKYNVEL